MHNHLIGTGIQVSHRHHPNLRREFNKALLCPALGLRLQTWFNWDTTTSKHLCLDIYGCLGHCTAGQSWVETSETEYPTQLKCAPSDIFRKFPCCRGASRRTCESYCGLALLVCLCSCGGSISRDSQGYSPGWELFPGETGRGG